MKLPLTSITVPARLRKDYGDIEGLKASLTEYGQLQALLLDPNNNLVDGGRRHTAISALGWTEAEVMYTTELSESRKKIMELEANWARKEMTWQENVAAIAEIHYFEVGEHALTGSDWSMKTTGAMLGVSVGNVQYALKLAEHIRKADPEIIACSGPVEALRILIRRRENALMAELVSRQQNASVQATLSEYNTDSPTFLAAVETEATTTTPPIEEDAPQSKVELIRVAVIDRVLQQPDLTMSVLYGLGPEVADHCICDPPYGIDLDNINQMDDRFNSVETMKVSHGVAQNQALFVEMFPTVFRAIRPAGFFFLWCDIMQWQRLYDLAIAAGFRVQRWPVVWHKTHVCLNQASQYNTTKNFEIAMVCRKPNALLVQPVTDSIILASGTTAKVKFGDHPFVKPIECWMLPINHLTLPGQLILDPFAGRGSSCVSAIELGRDVIAIEHSQEEFNHLYLNIKQAYKCRYHDKFIQFV